MRNPMNPSGYLCEGWREAILQSLANAKGFRIRAVDEYERKLDVTPSQYREMLIKKPPEGGFQSQDQTARADQNWWRMPKAKPLEPWPSTPAKLSVVVPAV